MSFIDRCVCVHMTSNSEHLFLLNERIPIKCSLQGLTGCVSNSQGYHSLSQQLLGAKGWAATLPASYRLSESSSILVWEVFSHPLDSWEHWGKAACPDPGLTESLVWFLNVEVWVPHVSLRPHLAPQFSLLMYETLSLWVGTLSPYIGVLEAGLKTDQKVQMVQIV